MLLVFLRISCLKTFLYGNTAWKNCSTENAIIRLGSKNGVILCAVHLNFQRPHFRESTEGWIVSKFDTTPAMSSYLLAVLVSEFDYIEGHTKSGVRVRFLKVRDASQILLCTTPKTDV